MKVKKIFADSLEQLERFYELRKKKEEMLFGQSAMV